MKTLSKSMKSALDLFRSSLFKDRRSLSWVPVDDVEIVQYGFTKHTFEALERRGLVKRVMIDPVLPGYRVTEAGRALLSPIKLKEGAR